MLFIPKNTKFPKQRKGKNFNLVTKLNVLNTLKHGIIGLKAIDSGRLTTTHLNACRQCMNKIMKKDGQVKINLTTDTPISKKPIEIRMGKGKGAVDHWVAKVSSGAIIFEIETNSNILALKALKAAQIKLPINTKIIFE
jgi:large subunit ribosomal protein L16